MLLQLPSSLPLHLAPSLMLQFEPRFPTSLLPQFDPGFGFAAPPLLQLDPRLPAPVFPQLAPGFISPLLQFDAGFPAPLMLQLDPWLPLTALLLQLDPRFLVPALQLVPGFSTPLVQLAPGLAIPPLLQLAPRVSNPPRSQLEPLLPTPLHPTPLLSQKADPNPAAPMFGDELLPPFPQLLWKPPVWFKTPGFAPGLVAPTDPPQEDPGPSADPQRP